LYWAFCGEIGTNFPPATAKESISVYLELSSLRIVNPIILAPIAFSGMMNFSARSAVYHAPFVPISYLPDSRPINRSSSLVPTYSN